MASVGMSAHTLTGRPGKAESQIISLIQGGIPLVSRPYAVIAEQAGMSEDKVINIITNLIDKGIIKRYGVVVQHRDLGYKANAMVVWDVPDDKLDYVPGKMKEYPFITLCYRRPRRPPDWPYNLFCMIHGHDREAVLKQLDDMISACDWREIPHAVLFSKRRFKQRGAHYISEPLNTCHKSVRQQNFHSRARPAPTPTDPEPSVGARPAREPDPGLRRKGSITLDNIDRIIINKLQGGFPICERPFSDISTQTGIDEDTLIKRIERLIKDGVISRFGPMYNIEKLGGIYTLAAMKLPQHDLMRVADIINSYPEVAHNYIRDHDFNLWFVLAIDSKERKNLLLQEMESVTGYPVHDMPKLEEFYVGLKFNV